jgi:hypothetical protein
LRKRTINFVLLIICFTFIVLTLIPLFLSYYVGPRITQRILEQQVETFLQEKVEVERARITIFGGFGIKYNNLKILGSDGNEFFRAQTFLLKPWIKSLILGRLRWKRIVLKDPTIHLFRTSEGEINFTQKRMKKVDGKDGGFFQKLQEMADHLPSQVFIRGGRIRLTDFGLSKDPVVMEMEEIDVTILDISPQKPVSIRFTGRFVGGMGEEFSISSKVIRIEDPFNPNQSEFQISLKTDSIDSQLIWPYLRSVLPFQNVRGLLDLKIAYRGRLTSFHSSGEMKIRHAQFTIPTLYTAAIESEEASLTYDLEYENEEIRISQLVFRIPDVSIQGSGSIHEVSSKNRSISLEFATGKTSFKDILPYLPDRVISKKLLPFLTDHGIQGILQVEKARFEGLLANLNAEGLRKNPQMLSVRTQIDAGSLLLDSKLPPIRNISGILTLEGDQARISDFRGEFLRSHILELSASISHLYSDPTMAVTFKGDLDLKGLLSLFKANRMPEEVRKAVAPIAKISGKAEMAGEIRHRFNKLSDLTYKGRLSLSDGQVRIAGFPLPLAQMKGEIQYNEKEILLSHFKWKMGKSLCRGTVSLRGYLRSLKNKIVLSKKLKIALDMGAKEVVLDPFLSKGRTEREIQIDPKSIWVNSTVTGKVRISKGSCKGFRFANFATSFVMKRGLLRFKKFQAEAPGGFVRFKGWINLNSRLGVSFKLIPKIHELDMTNAIPISLDHGQKPVLSGKLNLDGILAGSGNSFQKITRSLTGDLRLRATHGSIEGLEPLEGKGLPYNQAIARILIQKGVASTTDLDLDSDTISMAIKGQADLNNQSLDILIGARPLQKVDKILSNVPVAGWLLAGKDRSILTFSYRVKGKFDDLRLVK